MHIIKAKEQTDVVAIFKNHQAIPYSFYWAGKKFIVEGINLRYQKRVGDGKLCYFSVIAEENFFKLVFDTNALEWWIEEIYSE